MKETELAQKFVEYLSCFDLYFEVDFRRSVDIVAIEGNISMAFEVKTTFNFKVLEQAVENAKHFHYSYICVPNFFDSMFQRQLCRDYGVGLLVYEKSYSHQVEERISPRLNRHASISALKKRLSEENKKSIPGSKNGASGKITSFGVTVENLCFYVRRHPGCTIKEAIESISHHYSSPQSARSNILRWIKEGVIDGVTIEDGKIFPKQK